jgi:hemoglobin
MRPTLYEFAGGEPGFLALARAHHERCVADPELNHPFVATGLPMPRWGWDGPER